MNTDFSSVHDLYPSAAADEFGNILVAFQSVRFSWGSRSNLGSDYDVFVAYSSDGGESFVEAGTLSFALILLPCLRHMVVATVE